MTWHSGQDLSQTVFTCLYVLHLDNLPSATSAPSTSEPGPPIELLSLVLHSYVMAVLKSVDLASQEYARGNVLEVGIPIISFQSTSIYNFSQNSKKMCHSTRMDSPYTLKFK